MADAPETGIKYDRQDRQRQGSDGSRVPGLPVRPGRYGVIGDELDPDSIDIGDFYVEGFSIVSYIHPTDTELGNDFDKNADGTDQKFDPRSRVYVKLDRHVGERRAA